MNTRPQRSAARRRAAQEDRIIPFRGHSGAVYEFVASYAPWKNVPANFLFARLLRDNWWVVYVGQTQDTSDRFPDYDLWAEAVRRHDATHILTHLASPVLETREAEERDLILALDPPMNARRRAPPRVLGLGASPESLSLSDYARLMRRGR